MEKDLEIQEDLESFGWEVFRISETDFKASPEETLEGLWNKLNEIQIYPLQPSESKGFLKDIFILFNDFFGD